MIAGDHHRRNAGAETGRNRCSGFRARRIHQADQSDEYQPAFRNFGIIQVRNGIPAAAGQCQHAQSVGGHRSRSTFQFRARQAPHTGCVKHPGAERQYRLGCTLGIGHHAVGAGMKCGHAHAHRIKRQFSATRRIMLENLPRKTGALRSDMQCHFGRVSGRTADRIAGGVVALRHRREQALSDCAGHLLRRQQRALDATGFDAHPVLGQRAGFVGTDIGNRTQRLDAGQPAHQRLLFNHAIGTERECNGDNSRQCFGYRRHREADRSKQHQQRRFASQQSGDKDQRANQQYKNCQPPAEGREPLLQRCFRFFAGRQQRGNMPQFGRHAGRHHQTGAASVGHDGALVGHVAAVAERGIGFGKKPGILVHRHRFTGQRGFFHTHAHGFDQAQIRRHHVAGLQQHQIAGHQFAGGNHRALSVAQYGRRWRRNTLQGGHRLFGAIFLRKTNDGIEQQDGDNRQRIRNVTDHAGQHCGRHQHDNHEVGKLGHENMPGAALGSLLQQIGAVLRQASCCFHCGKTTPRIATQRR